MEFHAQRPCVKPCVNMSKCAVQLRALVTERLCAAAEEIVQLFVRTVAEYEQHEEGLGTKEPNDGQTLVKTGEEREAVGADVGVQTEWHCGKVLETPAQSYLKTEPEQSKEHLPLAAISVNIDCNEEEMSVHHQRTQINAEIESGEGQTQSDLDSEAVDSSLQSDLDLVLESNDTAESMSPQTFNFSDVASLAHNRTKILTSCIEIETKHHKCPQCDKVYVHRPSLFRHILTHKPQKPFKCSVCEKEFSQKTHLTLHMRIHTGEKPFSCPFCDKAFSDKSNASQHMRVHTGQKPFGCSVCGARFLCGKALSTHMSVHTGDRPFSCPDCGARYKQMASLKAHRWTHSGERPFRCSLCDRSFSQRKSLKKHVQVHEVKEVVTPGGGE